MNTPTTGPKGHHRFSPSTLNDRAACPGWDKDDSSDKTAANEGTMLHAACETRNLEGLDFEQTEAVKMCIGYVDTLSKGATSVVLEKNLQILKGLTSGTADVLILKGDTVHVIDHKFGGNVVKDADTNLQGWAYLLGAWDLFPTAKFGVVHFLMPRVCEGDQVGVVLKHKFSREADAPRMKLAIKTVIARAKKYFETRDENMLTPSAQGCLYCGRKAECPKMWDYALPIVKKYAPLEVVDEVHSSKITEPAKMVALIEASKILGKLVDSVNEHAKRFAIENGGIVGADGQLAYALAERSGTRKIRPEKVADVVDLLLESGLSEREILACSDLSLTQALDLVHEKAPKGKKSAARAAIEVKLNEMDALTVGAPSVYLKKVKKDS